MTETGGDVDPLTRLLDRKAIQQLADREISRRNRFSGPLAILLIDVDHLNEINCRYTLSGGDKVLVELAKLIASSLRPTDWLGRNGGDRFLVIAPETGLEEAEFLAERIRATVEGDIICYLDENIPVRVSIGVAVVEGNVTTEFEKMSKVAGAALAQAKVTGRNRCMVYSIGRPS